MIRNDITVSPFTQDRFIELLSAEGVDLGVAVPEQVSYLARYCESLGARTIVHEAHYMDRHYVDEYALYYSRMLSPPPNSVQRVHVFARAFSEERFNSLLEQSVASVGDREAVQRELMTPDAGTGADRGYLGYCSVRPVIGVPVGRTVLARLPDGDGRHRDIWATTSHDVHLANLSLTVEGIPFQQQDAAVGACATTALWSALVRAARQDGMRAPTPAEISEAATRGGRASGRPTLSANSGLTLQQLCDATRACGFSPEIVSAWDRPEIFFAALHTYLLSGIPVVLALGGKEGHAVTAVGFEMGATEYPRLQASVPVRSSRMRKVYVHDDRLGPYARAFMDPFVHPELEGVTLDIGSAGGTSEAWLVNSALAPVYPKMRLPVQSLLTLAQLLGGPIEQMVGRKRSTKLGVDFRYERAGTYLSRLSGRACDRVTAAQLVRTVALSRWCAVIRWYIADDELVEFVYDTTDIVRDAQAQNAQLLRAVVCLSPEFAGAVSTIATAFAVPTG